MRSLVLLAILTTITFAQMPDTPVRAVVDPGVVTTRQTITPAGVQSIFSGRVQGVAFGATPNELYVLNTNEVFRIDWRSNRVISRTKTGGVGGMQGIRYDQASKAAIVTTTLERKVRLLRLNDTPEVSTTLVVPDLGRFVAGSPAVHGDIAIIPITGDDAAAVVDLASGTVKSRISTGIAPFAAVMNSSGTTAYVSNWGGRVPGKDDPTAVIGYSSNPPRVVVDKRGVAATGTVAQIDVTTARVTATWGTGLHPTAMVLDEPHHRLYVANGNEDSVSVFDTTSSKLGMNTIPLQPFGERVAGIAPTALAISPDGSRLYVSCGGINAVAVVATASGKLEGLIPTAWYPNALSLSADGKYLAIATLLGAGSGWRDEPKRHYVHAYRGSVAVVEIPDAAQLDSYTAAVVENNHMKTTPPVARSSRSTQAARAVPVQPGDPSLIDHVVFVIKENRTYDQVFGDITEGNGDPSLVMFGENVTPNQHRLARQFVLLDNFYATGGNSADGHQWLTQANETDYAMWPGYTSRSYPFDGTDPIAYSNSGFLWDAALAAGKTVRIFGEYAGIASGNRAALFEAWKKGEDLSNRWQTVAPLAPLNALLVKNYPAYTTSIPDVVRARLFLAELKKWETAGAMPNLTFVQLPSNHTNGTNPGSNTPKAMVADNDYALGQIVEGLTRSPFWKKMAIFVVEDDAQNGVDHVDGHRTVALAISPYTRRGSIDSTFYSHTSMLKTIELMLGLRPLSLFDRIATDMRASFHDTADLTGYEAMVPAQSLTEMNPPLRSLNGQARRDAAASARVRWDIPDAAPSDRLNRILWRQSRGTTPYPAVRHSVFSPLSLDVDDDDRK